MEATVNKLILCSATIFTLISCEQITEISKSLTAEEAAADNGANAKRGIETAYIDIAIKPGDDFYQYALGTWLDTTTQPENEPLYSVFSILNNRSNNQVRRLIEELTSKSNCPGSIEQKIADYYSSYLDVAAINAKGLEPARADLDAITRIKTHDEVAEFMFGRQRINRYLITWVGADQKAPDEHIVYFSQGGLGLPNRDYYLEDKFADKREKYEAHIEDVLTMAGVKDAANKALAIYSLEYDMAKAHWTQVERRDSNRRYNLKLRDELQTFSPETPWNAILKATNFEGQKAYVVYEDTAIQKLGKIFTNTSVDVWKDYLTFHLINANATVLPKPFDDARFAFFFTKIYGVSEQKPRPERAVGALESVMGDAIGKVYVERFFPPETKKEITNLTLEISEVFEKRVDNLTWMSESTKAEAKQKLEALDLKIGYPDHWRDYSSLVVAAGDAYGNANRGAEFSQQFWTAKLGTSVDKTEWNVKPQEVNAYYRPPSNDIRLPAGILQPPFFDPKADAAVNYGAIGAIIGHEITHGYDDQGRNFDATGALRDWWAEGDVAKFRSRATRLGEQFAQYEPIEGFPVNPDQTMGENIADLGGLTIAYAAYKNSLNGAEAPIIDGFTGDQRFFIAYAQSRMSLMQEDTLKYLLSADGHSPDRYRVNGIVRNMDAWYEAFGITEDDDLYLPPEERVQIW